VLADSFNALGGGKWIDSGMAGYETARPVIVSRILGGDPPGATLLNPGKDAEDLIQAGLMQDLSEIAEQEHWRQLIRPASALAPCLKDGRVWCVPVNLHSGQWMWTNRKVFTDAGLPQPQTFSDVVAAAPTLRARGIKPIAVASGWATTLMLRNIAVGVGGLDLWRSIYARRNVGAAEGQAMRRVFEVIDAARGVVEPGDIFPQWNDAVEEVIRGRAAAVVMGDWAQAEFQAAGQVAGQDYDCLPGLGFKPALELASDYFFFPKQSDEKVTRTQMKLASLLVSKPVQIAFNVRKGSLPVRSDLDSQAVHSCMKKGLDVIDDPRNLFSSFTEAKLDWATLNEIDDLGLEFFNDHGMTAAEAQDRFVDIIKNASEQ
jgi:glucose/mannose transport system substrate-binding protein